MHSLLIVIYFYAAKQSCAYYRIAPESWGEAWSTSPLFTGVFPSWVTIHHPDVLLVGFRPRERWFHSAKLDHLGIHFLTPKTDRAEFVSTIKSKKRRRRVGFMK